MFNSAKYRIPPLKRTRDTFIDDDRSEQNPRPVLGMGRHLEVRRDKDKIREFGVTLYDVDFAIKSFIDQKMMLRVEDNGESIIVPTVYANSEKWASIQKDGFLKDKKGKTIAPLITFRRSSVAFNSNLKRNKVATTKQIAYIMQQPYSKANPYDKFSTQYEPKRSYEYFLLPLPDYVDISYDFIVWCEYQNQLNGILEAFIRFAGQAFGDKNFFKFSTNIESFGIEDSNTTGQDRIVRSTFQILVHAYLIPKDLAAQTTIKRVVSPNKIQFITETFRDPNSAQNPETINYFGAGNDIQDRIRDNRARQSDGNPSFSPNTPNVDNFTPINNGSNSDKALEDLKKKVDELVSISLNKSPNVYTFEIDQTDSESRTARKSEFEEKGGNPVETKWIVNK